MQDNSPWSWHFEEVTFVEAAIELCDGRPSDVERAGIQFGGGRFCPWTAIVIPIDRTDSRLLHAYRSAEVRRDSPPRGGDGEPVLESCRRGTNVSGRSRPIRTLPIGACRRRVALSFVEVSGSPRRRRLVSREGRPTTTATPIARCLPPCGPLELVDGACWSYPHSCCCHPSCPLRLSSSSRVPRNTKQRRHHVDVSGLCNTAALLSTASPHKARIA
jgi:hypothetical protein